MELWKGIKRRRQEEINSYSLTSATLTANVVAFLRSFGDSKADLPIRDEYLPFRFVDLNSPKYQLQRKLSSDTIAVLVKVKESGKIPPKLAKELNAVPGMLELLEENKLAKEESE